MHDYAVIYCYAIKIYEIKHCFYFYSVFRGFVLDLLVAGMLKA